MTTQDLELELERLSIYWSIEDQDVDKYGLCKECGDYPDGQYELVEGLCPTDLASKREYEMEVMNQGLSVAENY